MLIPIEKFLEHKHKLIPAGYCEEWWFKDLEKAGFEVKDKKFWNWKPSFEEAYSTRIYFFLGPNFKRRSDVFTV